MKRKYGEEQRDTVKTLKEELIKELEVVYMRSFDKIANSGLGAGTTAKLTQNILLSKDSAITFIKRTL